VAVLFRRPLLLVTPARESGRVSALFYQVNFSSARTTKRFHRRDVRLQFRSFARCNPRLTHTPTPTGFAEIVCDDLSIVHAVWASTPIANRAKTSLHANANIILWRFRETEALNKSAARSFTNHNVCVYYRAGRFR
jgi:hypothetical protein